jgi:hypothetical protein
MPRIDPAHNIRYAHPMTTHTGGCHCGAVRFEVEAPEHLIVQDCNCSICSMSGFLHLIVPKANFKLTQGQHSLATYTFGTHIAKHHFCRICGIKSFYVPRSNPDGIDVNVRCLDESNISMTIEPFDGRHWELNADALAHLSKPV